MEKGLFNDLIAACHEAIGHGRGDVELNSDTVTISDEEVEFNRIMLRKLEKLPESGRRKAMQYVDELLLAAE